MMLLFNLCKRDRNWKCLIQSHVCRKFISWLALLSVCHEPMFAKRLWNASLHHVSGLIYIVYTAKTSLRTEIPRDTHTRTRTVSNWKIIQRLQELTKVQFLQDTFWGSVRILYLSFQTLTLNFSTQQLFSQQCRQTTDKRTSSKTLQRYNSIHWQNSLLFLLL